jgi:ERCC4-related helicase
MNFAIFLFSIVDSARSYQEAIIEVALFQNTLVALPTGLGKTFISEVVMLNFHRWYPTGLCVCFVFFG